MAWIIFIIGLIFRLLHYPETSMISLLGTLLILIHAIIYLAKNVKKNLPTSFLHLSLSLLTTYILFRLQYWSIGPMILGYSLFFIFVLLVTISFFVLLIKSKAQFKFPQVFIALYYVFSLSYHLLIQTGFITSLIWTQC